MDAFIPITLEQAKTTPLTEWPMPGIGDGGQQFRSVRRVMDHSKGLRGLFESDHNLWPTLIVWCIGDMAPADVDFVRTHAVVRLFTVLDVRYIRHD